MPQGIQETDGDIADISIRCECGEARPLMRATIPGTLGHCDGCRRSFSKPSCWDGRP